MECKMEGVKGTSKRTCIKIEFTYSDESRAFVDGEDARKLAHQIDLAYAVALEKGGTLLIKPPMTWIVGGYLDTKSKGGFLEAA